MFKKIIIILTCFVVVFLTGCTPSKQIEKSSIAETITVNINDNKIYYTFYLISSKDEPDSVSVQAASLKEAYSLAKKSYIPNLSLSKFELFVIDEKVHKTTLKNDIEYMSKQYFVSPLSYITLSDANTLEYFKSNKDASKIVTEHILLLKNKNDFVNINTLSVFNRYFDNKSTFCACYISSDKELKAVPYKINE